MIPIRVRAATFVFAGLTPLAAAQVDANLGQFAGAEGVLTVDAQTGAAGQLLTKDLGYFSIPPVPRVGTPDFRTSSIAHGASVQIDAFSIGEDWIIANEVGECYGPAGGGWAVLMFSVTGTTPGAAGGQIAFEAANPGGAAGDVFAYEFKGNSTSSLSQGQVFRVLDSADIRLQAATGTPNITAYDWFAAKYSVPGVEVPRTMTAYFSVTSVTSTNVPLSWCGGDPALRSGATVFQTRWRAGGAGAWELPSVYLAPGDLGLVMAADVDALAVDTSHHFAHYVLFSTVNPPAGQAIRFLNRGTGWVDTYRFANGGPSVGSQLGLGTSGDVDALCAADPDHDYRSMVTHATTAVPPPWWPPLGNVSCVVDLVPGPDQLHGFSASPDPTATHWWYVNYPAQGLLLGPVFEPRMGAWHGSPTHFVQPMNTSMLGQRAELGVIESGTTTVGSRFVAIDEWRKKERAVVAPERFADTEGGTSANIWYNAPNRVQCVYDTSHFLDQGVDHPIRINEISWRQGNVPPPGSTATYPVVNVYVDYCANDYSALSTTFSNNRLLGLPPAYSGPVVVEPVWGDRPHHYAIRIPLTTPFVFDPTMGLDLLVELEILSGPSPSNQMLTATSFSSFATPLVPDHRASTVRSVGSTGTSVGTASPFCPICRFGYEELPDVATTTAYGTGCYRRPASFYERFTAGAFDLGADPNSSAVVNSLVLTPAGGGYTVSAGTNAWHNPSGPGLAMTDDDVATVGLPASFSTPLGSTSQLTIYSNGFVLPWGSTYATGFPPTVEDLLSGPPRYAPCWADLLPDGATNVHNVYADYDSVASTYYVTWLGVPTYLQGSVTLPGGNVTMQIAFHLANGVVEYRWQGCRLPTEALVGWTPGGGALDPGQTDLDRLPIAGGSDDPGSRLSASPRAVLGNTVDFTSSAPGALGFVHIMSLTSAPAPVALAFLGLPDCWLYVSPSPAAFYTLLGGPTAVLPFAIPFNLSLVGFQLHHQSVAFVPGVNAFGALTSNALVMTVGSQ